MKSKLSRSRGKISDTRLILRGTPLTCFVTARHRTASDMPWKPAFPSRFRKGTVAACLGALVLLLTATQGFSKLPAIVHSSLAIPYTVDWESIRYEKNGSSSIEMYGTSFSHNAGELVLSTITPGHPFETFIRQTLDTIGL